MRTERLEAVLYDLLEYFDHSDLVSTITVLVDGQEVVGMVTQDLEDTLERALVILESAEDFEEDA